MASDAKHTTPAEDRYIAVGEVDGRYVFVAFEIRGERIRPISARYMHAKEASAYEASA